MMDENPTPSPLRLLQLSPTMSTLFTDAELEYREELNEMRAWQRLQMRLADSDQPEVRMARVDLLARLGRVDEALRASDLLLGSPSGRAHRRTAPASGQPLLRDHSP